MHELSCSRILSYENNNLEMIRPNPQLGEIIIFTPFLVHGSAINAQTDKTRFSLEGFPCLNY